MTHFVEDIVGSGFAFSQSIGDNTAEMPGSVSLGVSCLWVCAALRAGDDVVAAIRLVVNSDTWKDFKLFDELLDEIRDLGFAIEYLVRNYE